MKIFRVACIGHREMRLTDTQEHRLSHLIADLFHYEDYVEFCVGHNGDFDKAITSLVRRAQTAFPRNDGSLTLVLPYHVKDTGFFAEYDDVLYPVDPTVYPKAAIGKRNEWMINRADLLITFVAHDHGGAYHAWMYAKQLGKPTVNVADPNAPLRDMTFEDLIRLREPRPQALLLT